MPRAYEPDPSLYGRPYANQFQTPTTYTTPQVPQQQPQQYESPSLLRRIGSAIVKPAVESAQFYGEGLTQASRMLLDPKWREAVQTTNAGMPLTAEQAKYVLSQPESYFMPEKDINIFEDPKEGMIEGLKRTATAESYLAPGLIPGAGAGATVGSKMAVGAGRGAVSGGLMGFGQSERGKELQSTGLGVGLGAATGAALAAAGAGAEKAGAKIKSAAQRKAMELQAKPTSTTAARIYQNIWNIPKRKVFDKIRRQQTQAAKDLIDMKVTVPKSVDQANNINHTVLSNMGDTVDDYMTAVDIDVPTNPIQDKVDDALRAMPTDINGKPVHQPIKQTVTNLLPKTGGNPNTAKASDLIRAERTLQKLITKMQIAEGRTGEPIYGYQADGYQAAANEIKRLLDVAGDVQGVSIRDFMTPDRIAAIRDAAGPETARRFAQAQAPSAVRSLMQPFVISDKALAITLAETPGFLTQALQRMGTSIAGGLGGGMMFGIPGLIGGSIIGKLAEPFASQAAETAGMVAFPAAARGINTVATGALTPAAQGAAGSIMGALGGAAQSPYVITPAMEALKELITGDEMYDARQQQYERSQ